MARATRRLDILEEHFEELAILWEQREAAVEDPELDRADLTAYEARAEAHRDALFLAEDEGRALARAALASDDPPALTAATFVLLDHGESPDADLILEALQSGSPEARAGLRLGLRHSPLGRLHEALAALANSDDLGLALVAADVLTFREAAYGWPSGVPLCDPERLLGATDASERTLAHEVLGRLEAPPDIVELEALLTLDGAGREQRAALRRAHRAGLHGLHELCRRMADRSDEALAFLGVLGSPDAAPLLCDASRNGPRATAALRGLGALGSPETFDTLLAHAAREETREAAAAAVRRMVGHAPERLAPPPPPPVREADLEGDFEAPSLPLDTAALAAFWQVTRPRLDASRRYQAGAPVPHPITQDWLNTLPLDARADWALLARMSCELPATPAPAVRTTSWR